MQCLRLSVFLLKAGIFFCSVLFNYSCTASNRSDSTKAIIVSRNLSDSILSYKLPAGTLWKALSCARDEQFGKADLWIIDSASRTIKCFSYPKFESVATIDMFAVKQQIGALPDERLAALQRISDDTVVMLFSESIVLFALSEAKVLKKVLINQWDEKREWDSLNVVPFELGHRIVYDKPRRQCYFYARNTKFVCSSKKYYQQPCVASLNLNDFIVRALPISYPKQYQQNYVGDYASNQLVVNGDTLLVTWLSFPIVSKYVWLNNKLTKLTEMEYSPSCLDTVKQQWLPWTKKLPSIGVRRELIIQQRAYDRTIYHDGKGYRFFRAAQPLVGKDGTYNSLDNKACTIQVLDANHSCQFEYILRGAEPITYRNTIVLDNALHMPDVSAWFKPTDVIRFHVLPLQ
jgi:hypothetical protein